MSVLFLLSQRSKTISRHFEMVYSNAIDAVVSMIVDPLPPCSVPESHSTKHSTTIDPKRVPGTSMTLG